MKRAWSAAFAALALMLVALFAPTGAYAATVVDDPFVSVSTNGEIGAAYLEWYTSPDVDTVEVVATDSAGATSTRTAPATDGGMSFASLPAGDWSASVTAISAGTRSNAVPVRATITGVEIAPAPAPEPEPAPVPSAAAPAPVPSATAVPAANVAFTVTPGPDGTATGAQVAVRASGLTPASAYRVTLSTTGATLTEGIVAADGTIDASFALPADLPAGSHTFAFAGIAASGEPATGEYVLTVQAADEVAVAAPEAPAEADQGGIDEILALEGDAAVPYLVTGAVAATAATGAVAGAAASVNMRLRRLKLTRLLDLEYPGTGGGSRGVLGGFLDLVAKLRGAA